MLNHGKQADFFATFSVGFDNYIHGEWDVAKLKFEEAMRCLHSAQVDCLQASGHRVRYVKLFSNFLSKCVEDFPTSNFVSYRPIIFIKFVVSLLF